MRDDFPTPEEPSSAAVAALASVFANPGCRISRISAMPSPRNALARIMRTPIAADSVSRNSSSEFSQRSHLFNTITGFAPLSHASVRYRSMRRGLNSRFSELTRKMTSTFAATICSSVFLPAILRENLLLRLSTR